MKRVYIFSFIVLCIVFMVTYIISKPKDYTVSYKKNGYDIIEKYDKKNESYSFKIMKDKLEYYFIQRGKYSIKRKIVSSIANKDDCITLKIKDYTLGTECIKDGELVSKSVITQSEEPKKINTISRFDIYDTSNKYYAWNSFGLFDILNKSEHNFIETETYDNSLSYQINNYVIFPDYDSKKNFNTFYIFDVNNNKYKELKTEFEISFSSYFMGSVGDKVYLFDKKNKKQYEIDLKKMKVIITSEDDRLKYYDGSFIEQPIEKFIYNEIKFKYNDIYNYEIIDNKLYLKMKGYNKNILLSNLNVKDIIKISSSQVYYLSGTSLYKFDLVNGETKLLEYFDWNFSYLNKIFIFD